MKMDEVIQLRDVMDAYIKGAKIEERKLGEDLWVDSKNPEFWNNKMYFRVKSIPRYVPFTNDDMLIGKIVRETDNINNGKYMITYQSDDNLMFGNAEVYDYDELLEFVFVGGEDDGKICGKLV